MSKYLRKEKETRNGDENHQEIMILRENGGRPLLSTVWPYTQNAHTHRPALSFRNQRLLFYFVYSMVKRCVTFKVDHKIVTPVASKAFTKVFRTINRSSLLHGEWCLRLVDLLLLGDACLVERYKWGCFLSNHSDWTQCDEGHPYSYFDSSLDQLSTLCLASPCGW